MRAALPAVAERTVRAVVVEVPSYAGAFDGEMGRVIENAVRLALGGFLDLAGDTSGADPATPMGPALHGAYGLGRGEARGGRSVDALLAAYRVGARVAWRELSAVAVAAALPGEALARFAELVFAYIDRLSALSVAGHDDERATTGLVLQRYREQLAHLLVTGAAPDDLAVAAERAGWAPPVTLTAVVVPQAAARAAVLDPRTLRLDVPDAPLAALLVPDAARAVLLRSLGGGAVVGPARPWTRVQGSYQRALRATELGLAADPPAPVDTETRLAELVLRADPQALADLRAQVLAPLADLRPATRDKLLVTLRAWLLHQGRRDDVAAALFVHPQTVRYRMGQLRERYGDRLDDPRTVLELVVALGA
ncbi:MAG: PucR family transcriptional regulator [Pseudonocardia sp.]